MHDNCGSPLSLLLEPSLLFKTEWWPSGGGSDREEGGQGVVLLELLTSMHSPPGSL